MSRYEKSGFRDLTYSRWHRSLADDEVTGQLAYFDLDGIECCARCHEPLALIETAFDVGQSHKPTTMMEALARRSGLPAYLVFYKVRDGQVWGFRVRMVSPRKSTEQVMTPVEWAQMLRELRHTHVCAPQARATADAIVAQLTKLRDGRRDDEHWMPLRPSCVAGVRESREVHMREMPIGTRRTYTDIVRYGCRRFGVHCLSCRQRLPCGGDGVCADCSDEMMRCCPCRPYRSREPRGG